MTAFHRRHVLEGAAAAALTAAVGVGSSALGIPAPLPPLPRLGDDDALLVVPGDAQYEQYQVSYNRRTMQRPRLRALCRTAAAVAALIEWCRENNLPFALRSGGHSFEGFSQSSSVVIDTRLMAGIEPDSAGSRVRVGAGATLGAIYKALSMHGRTIPAGTCPTVGISGHALGGGFGLLARAMGLSCDSLESVELVDADGKIRHVDATRDADLFWALRGGGGGTFGAVTQFEFKTHVVGETVVFGLSWLVPAPQAIAIMTAWQAWAPHAPHEITSFFRLSKARGDVVRLRCAGQSLGSEAALRRELQTLIDVAKPSETTIETLSFFGAVNHFSGGWDYESDYSKGKSSYVEVPLCASALGALFEAMEQDAGATPVLVCDAYGGAITDVAADATAFAHRGALYCIQYHATWGDAASSARQIEQIDRVYAALQPYVSEGAYVNYCDLELADWGQAYWGSNLPRLKKIKSSFDPGNVFTHAQSV